MTSPIDIRSDHLRIVQDVLRAHLPDDAKTWVFGSRVAWTTKDSSDLDLAVEGKVPFDLKVMRALQDAFEDSDLPYTVDVVDINRISNGFKRVVEGQRTALPIPKNLSGTALGKHDQLEHGSEQPIHERGSAEEGQAIAITAKQRKIILSLLNRHLPGVAAWVHGSRANRSERPASGLGLVVFSTPEQDGRVSGLRKAFEKSNLPFQVDLSVWDKVPKSFREQIEAGHVVLAEGENNDPSGRDWLYHPQFPEHWDKQALCSMAQWVNGLAFRDIEFSKTGKPVIKIAEIKKGISSQTKFTHQTFDDSVCVRYGDLLFSWSGQPETSIDASWWRGPEGWLNQHIFRVTPSNDLDTTFFYYLLRYLRPNFVKIARNKQTTGLGHVTKRDLKRIKAATPPLPEQRAIAHILGTLDDKIELNRKMNRTLEAMAQALFKSWFIDFDPVHAKMEGRDTGLPKHIADLFPDRMADSALGKIPEGWGVYRLDELAEHHTKSIAPFSFPEVKFEYFSIPAHDSGLMPAVERGANIKSNKTIVPQHAVLLSKLNPEILRVWLPDSPKENMQICSTEFLAFTPRNPANQTLLFSLFVNPLFRTMLQSMVTGTSKSHQRVPPTALKRREVLSGTPALFARFDAITVPMVTRIVRNRAETYALNALRNTLLPKLISGDIVICQSEGQQLINPR